MQKLHLHCLWNAHRDSELRKTLKLVSRCRRALFASDRKRKSCMTVVQNLHCTVETSWYRLSPWSRRRETVANGVWFWRKKVSDCLDVFPHLQDNPILSYTHVVCLKVDGSRFIFPRVGLVRGSTSSCDSHSNIPSPMQENPLISGYCEGTRWRRHWSGAENSGTVFACGINDHVWNNDDNMPKKKLRICSRRVKIQQEK